MPPSDEFDTLIQALHVAPEATRLMKHAPAPPHHPVLWFAVGCGLFLLNAILLYVFVWLLRHG